MEIHGPQSGASGEPARFRLRVDPSDPDRPAKVSPHIEQLTWVLDESIPLPVGGWRVGVDGVVGLIPGVGDILGLVAGLVVVGAGIVSGVAAPTILRMLWNVMLTATVGTVPVVGDTFDFAYKANTRNLALIHADLADRRRTARRSLGWLALWVIGIVTVVVGAIVATVAIIWWIMGRIF